MAPPREKNPNDPSPKASRSDPSKADRSGLRSAGFLLAIPSLLIISPLAGFFLGNLGDRRFHTSPWLGLSGLLLGFLAAGREVWLIYRKYLASQER